jgi:type III restriction enzyme
VQSINLSKGNPMVTIEFDIKGSSGIRKVARVASEGYNLFENSGELAEYKNGCAILRIDGRDSSVKFINVCWLFGRQNAPNTF